ncbi:neural proliferation differentiation and control protein 1 [Brachionichthys hirsutus]|uniref:neural proliferation differentiation and control protein 1 n=1 Tax=Brachionichthys hirsutus TaxID=412623 RepID=UPI0036052DA8
MRAPLLLQAAVVAALLAPVACLTGSHLCPRSLDCARAGRNFCQPGGSHCGPCLRPLVENAHGRCVVRRRRPAQPVKGKEIASPELDQEIDFLSAVISKQRTETRLPAPPLQDVSNLASKQLPVPGPGPGHLLSSATEQPPSQSVPFTSTNHTPAPFRGPIILPYPANDRVFIMVSSVCIVAASMALVVAGVCWVRLQKGVGLTQKADYAAYGLLRAPTFDCLPGDKKLAQSAQMYHYQHQKQQMLSLERRRDEPKVPESGASTDEENDDGDFTVYECPGLAPTGEMEVKNPLFDDSTLYFQRFHK